MPFTSLQYGDVQGAPAGVAPSGGFSEPGTGAAVAPPGGTFGGFGQFWRAVSGDQPAQNPEFLGTRGSHPIRDAGTGYIGQLLTDAARPDALISAPERARLRNTANLLQAVQAESAYDAQRRNNLFQLILEGQDARIPDLLNRNLALGQNVVDSFTGGLNTLAEDTDERLSNTLGQQRLAEQGYSQRIADLLDTVGGTGRGIASDITRRYNDQDAYARQSLQDRGLAGLTDNVLAGQEADRNRELLGLEEQLNEQALGARQRASDDALAARERGLGISGQYELPLLQQLASGIGQAAQIGESQRATDTALAQDLTSRRLGSLADDMRRQEAPTLTQLVNLAQQALTAAPYPVGGTGLSAGSLAGLI